MRLDDVQEFFRAVAGLLDISEIVDLRLVEDLLEEQNTVAQFTHYNGAPHEVSLDRQWALVAKDSYVQFALAHELSHCVWRGFMEETAFQEDEDAADLLAGQVLGRLVGPAPMHLGVELLHMLARVVGLDGDAAHRPAHQRAQLIEGRWRAPWGDLIRPALGTPTGSSRGTKR